MSTYVTTHHLGILYYDSNGVQRQIGGQNAAVLASANSINPAGMITPGRSNAGLAHNRTVPSVATISDAVVQAENQATITRNNPGLRDQFNGGVITQIA